MSVYLGSGEVFCFLSMIIFDNVFIVYVYFLKF